MADDRQPMLSFAWYSSTPRCGRRSRASAPANSHCLWWTDPVSKFPWKDFAPALAALIGLGVAWGVARGVLDEAAGTVVNAAAGVAVAAVVAWSAWLGWRRSTEPISGIELKGELRSGLIDRVRSRWIGMRDDSGRLTGEGKLAKDLALGDQLKVLLYRSAADTTAHPTSSLDAWKRSGHGMVLTGGPGAGKSVQLLLLAEILLNAAGRDPNAGVPVILGLAPWRSNDDSRGSTRESNRAFEDWLVTEIHAKFRIPKEDSRTWLAQGDLIPILDGLDEVPPDRRPDLFKQLVRWVKDRERPPAAWALGCRQQEYAKLDPNYNLIGPRNTFWSVKSVGDEERIRFLSHAQKRVNTGWQPVIDALERGEARHLTIIDRDDQGVLATPLGLTIAVEAYQPNDLNDQPRPEDLLNVAGDWDRLWARYVSHRYLVAHSDPNEDAAESKQRYTFDEARRWLATLASEKIGTGREIDVLDIESPNQPAGWVNFCKQVEEPAGILAFLFGCLIWWLGMFSAFGALIGWRGWSGAVGLAIAIAIALICGLTLRGGGWSKQYAEVGFHRVFAQVLALVFMLGLPGFLIIGAGLSWPGDPLIRSIQPMVSRLDGFGFQVGEIELRVGNIQLDGWGEGAVTGVAVALMIALLDGLILLWILLDRIVTLYHMRDLSHRPENPETWLHQHLWWVDDVADDLNELYGRWMARHLLLRWWYYGSPLGSRKPTGLVPHPDDWDRFLDWAAHRGYLRRVGNQYVWIHETLRIWFRQYLDLEILAALRN